MPHHAKAFCHQHLQAAWRQATQYAGSDGRVATLPDIVAARLATRFTDFPWKKRFITSSAEYFGRDRKGRLVLAVSHGSGPQFPLPDVSNHMGSIHIHEFWRLLNGAYGEVTCIPYTAITGRYQYPFQKILNADEALNDPLLAARLGPDRAAFVTSTKRHIASWHRDQRFVIPENRHGIAPKVWRRYLRQRLHYHTAHSANPYFMAMTDAHKRPYAACADWLLKEDKAIAYLLSFSHLSIHLSGIGEYMAVKVSCHEWWHESCVVGVPAGATLAPLLP